MKEALDAITTIPVPLILMIVLGILFWRRRLFSLLLIGLGGLSLAALSLPVTGQALTGVLVGTVEPWTESDSVDAIVVPCAGIYAAPDGSWWPSERSVVRAGAGSVLHDQTGVPLVLSGGAPLGEPEAEATVVARALGLGRETILETTASDTAETASAVARLVAKRGGERVVLVTSPVHIARMAASLRAAGLDVLALPAVAPVRGEPPFGALDDFIPSVAGLGQSSAAIREMAAIGWYLLNGQFTTDDLSVPPLRARR